MKDPIIPDGLPPEVANASAEAIHAAKNAAQAIENARALQAIALSESSTRSLSAALREVFGEYSEQQRFIDTKQIPLICKDIATIRADIKEITDTLRANDSRYVNVDQFWPVKTIVYGLVGTMLLSVLGAIMALVVMTNHT